MTALFVLCFVAAAPQPACAQFGSWQSDAAAAYQPDFNDPASAMRLRIEQVADHGSGGRLGRWAFSPCNLENAKWGQGVCWSSYGRNLHMVVPKLAFNAMSMLMPHTIYSYQSVDLRFPPAIRLHLPFNATTTMGYESYDDFVAIRLEFDF